MDAPKAESLLANSLTTPDQLEQRMRTLEKEMFALAKDLEFEAAAQVRDQIEQLREQFVRT